MSILVLNCSPKGEKSNSKYFTNLLLKELPNENIEVIYLLRIKDFSEVKNKIKEVEKIVIVSPLYVDVLPANLLELMVYLYENNKDDLLHNKKVYGILNCGFLEGKQNKIAINVLKAWCKRMNINLSGAIGIGAGEMMNIIKFMPYKIGPNRSLYKAMKAIGNSISSGENMDVIYTKPSFVNGFIFRLCATITFYIRAKKLGVSVNELNKKIIDV